MFQAFEADAATIDERRAASETVGNGTWVAPGKGERRMDWSARTSTRWRSASAAIATSDCARSYTMPVGFCGEHSKCTRAPCV